MASSEPLIYAELLSNIRQISVIIALNAPCDPTIKVELSEDGCQFNMFDHGKSHTLMLPGQANPNTQLQKPALGSKELSWRLPLAGQAQRANQEDAQSCDAPWSAKTLGGSEEFACKNCGTTVLKKGSIRTWKDLPSENWAEMMDFWHCHKPDAGEEKDNGSSHENSDKDLAERGYGANSKFAAQPGVGFVDIATFLVSESDCTNITFVDGKQAPDEDFTSLDNANANDRRIPSFSLLASDSISSNSSLPSSAPIESNAELSVSLDNNDIANKNVSPTLLRCANCLATLGQFEGGLRLTKWLITRSPSPSAVLPTLPSSLSSLPSWRSSSYSSIASSRLSMSFVEVFPTMALDVLRSQLSSHILLLPSISFSSRTVSPALLTWIFMPSLRCSSTASSGSLSTKSGPGVPVMKIFWKVVKEDAIKLLRNKLGLEEMEQPAEAIIELECALQGSSLWLPPSSRNFQEWKVGLLEKFVE